MSSSGQFTTPECQLSFVKVWKAVPYIDQSGNAGEPKFSCSFIFNKTDDLSQMIAAYKAVEAADWDGNLPMQSRHWAAWDQCAGFQDGAKRYPENPFYADKVLLGASQDEERWVFSAIRDANNAPMLDKSQMYSGCFGHGLLTFYGYKGGKGGINCSLHGVLKTKDGDRLGGEAIDAASGFAGVAGNAQSAPEPANNNTAGAAGAADSGAVPPPPSEDEAPEVPDAHVMTPAANGVSYDAYIAKGWTDALLIKKGLMVE